MIKFLSFIATIILFLIYAHQVSAQNITPPFHPNSIWNKPISENPVIHPSSTQMIQYLLSSFNKLHIDGVSGLWSVPVYTSNINTPNQLICDVTQAWPCMSWPVPTNTIPTNDSDGKIALVDPVTQRVFSGWRFQPSTFGGGQWTIDGGAFGWSYTSTYGDGVHVWGNGLSGGRVSFWNYYAGLFYPEEIKQGHIDHALHINIPQSRAKQGYNTGGAIWPAFRSDGQSTDPYAIPLGSHFQLDPTLNVDSLNLSPSAKIIAKALQKYGAWLGDTGEITTINAAQYMTGSVENPVLDTTPWQNLLTSTDLYNIPMDKMRILVTNPADYYQETGTPVPTPTSTPAPNPSADANNDTKIDGIDYIIWLIHFNENTQLGPPLGDFDANNIVNINDFNYWLTNYTMPSANLQLIDIDNGSLLQNINQTQTLSASQLSAATLKFQATTATKSIRWTTTRSFNPSPVINIDNNSPYTIVCDGSWGYCPWDVGVGIYTITIESYNQPDALGTKLSSFTYTITVQ